VALPAGSLEKDSGALHLKDCYQWWLHGLPVTRYMFEGLAGDNSILFLLR
jgi:hypothetical protein